MVILIQTKHTNFNTTNFYLLVNNGFLFTCDSSCQNISIALHDTCRSLKFFIRIQEGREELGCLFKQIHMRFRDFTVIILRSKREASVSTSCNLLIWILSNSSSSRYSLRTILIPRTVITCSLLKSDSY